MANLDHTNSKEFYSQEHFEAGQKFAEVNGAIVEVLECNEKTFGCCLVVKFYGGSKMRISTAEEDVYTTNQKKRRLPSWIKRGMVIYDYKKRKDLLIESVGNCHIQLRYEGSADIRNIIMHTCCSSVQPIVPSWATVGAKVKQGRLMAEILSIDGYMAKIKLQIGAGESCILDASINELRPGYNEHEYGMTDDEISIRDKAIHFRGRYSKLTKSEEMELEELFCRRMINSCLIYGQLYDFYDEHNSKFVRYGKEHEELLGYDLTLKLLRAQQERFKHAKVGYAGTDHEGCSYNYCKWDVA